MRRDLIVVLTVVALAALIAMAGAQPPVPGGGPGPGGPGGFERGGPGGPRGMVTGTVVNATDREVILTNRERVVVDVDRSVALTDESAIVLAEAGVPEDLVDGAWVSVSGRFNDEGVLDVYRAQVGDAVPWLGGFGMGFGRGSTATGQLSQLAGNQVTLTLTIALPALTEGMPISVAGALDADGNLVPTRLALGESIEDVASPFRGMMDDNAIISFGTITGIAEGAVTLSLTATLQPDAQITAVKLVEPADIMPGGPIFVRGETQDDGSVIARTVLVGEFQNLFGGRGGPGDDGGPGDRRRGG